MTDLLRQTLTRRGYLVLSAASAREALVLMQTHSAAVRLVLTDVTMPDMSGITLVQELARLYPALPVVIASGIDATPDLESLPPNVQGVLQKPYQGQLLAERIRAILDAS
jgi:two-component system cell cycle sensor histidine kinase/response regulator CckA